MCQKKVFIQKNLVLVLEMAVLECFGWEHSHGPLRVKNWNDIDSSLGVHKLEKNFWKVVSSQ